MKRKTLFYVLLTVGIVLAVVSLLLPLFSVGADRQSVGIVGGAGAPTYLFLLRQLPTAALFPFGIVMALAGAVGLLVCRENGSEQE